MSILEKYLKFRTGMISCDNPDCTRWCANCLMPLTELAQNAHEISLVSSLLHYSHAQNHIVEFDILTPAHASVKEKSMLDALRSIILDPFTNVVIVKYDGRYKLVFRSNSLSDLFPFMADVPQVSDGTMYPCAGDWSISFPIDKFDSQWVLGSEYQGAHDFTISGSDSMRVYLHGVVAESLEYDIERGEWVTPRDTREIEFAARGPFSHFKVNSSHYLTALISYISLRLSLEMMIHDVSTVEDLFSVVNDGIGLHVEYAMKNSFIRGKGFSEEMINILRKIREIAYYEGLESRGSSWDVFRVFVTTALREKDGYDGALSV